MQENHPAPNMAAGKKPRLPAIEYIRGISMMGVIGIHVGSQYIGNPASNEHLTALFEIFTRFSVPIFLLYFRLRAVLQSGYQGKVRLSRFPEAALAGCSRALSGLVPFLSGP